MATVDSINHSPTAAWRQYATTPSVLSRVAGGYMGTPGFYGEMPEDTLRNVAGVLRVLQEVQQTRSASINDIPDWAGVNDGFSLILDLVAATAANQAKHMEEARKRAEGEQS